MSQHTKFRVLLSVAGAIAVFGIVGYWLTARYVRSSAPETLREAERYLSLRKNARARESLRWLLWFEPEQHRALLITGVSLNADEMFPEAIETLERIPHSSPSMESAGVALAASLISDGQLERAETVLTQHLAAFPWSLGAHERLARLYLLEFRLRDATALLLDQRRRYPDDLSVLPDLLEVETTTPAPQAYVERLEAADRAHPDQAPVVLALARAYSQMGRIEPARRQFEAALRLRPDDPATRVLAAEFYLRLGELEVAESLLEAESFSIVPDDDRFWILRCRIAEQSGNIADAYSDVQQALSMRPNDETYLLTCASLARQLGRVDDAAHAAEASVRIAEARNQLFVLAGRLNRDQPDPGQCREIADLLERLGHPDQAADWRRVGSAVEEMVDPVVPSAGRFGDAVGSNMP